MPALRSRMFFALMLGGALAAAAAPLPTQSSDPAAGIVVAKAELSPATEEAFLRLYFPADQLVESATRHPKPISQIAENVSVITAAEIEAMNAHTVAEVLARVPGIFPEFLSYEFGGTFLAHIQGSGEPNSWANGSSDLHVTVLVDGMRWNSTTAGPYFQNIPVAIVDRIEVVKGPASSTWGSSLGGVINILTKRAGRPGELSGSLSGSVGEYDRWDARGEVAAGIGPVGAYVQGQGQHADWRGEFREFDNKNLFAKAEAGLGADATLTLTGGYSRPEMVGLRLEDWGIYGGTEVPTRFGRAAVDADLGTDVSVHGAVYRFEQDIVQPVSSDGTYDAFGSLPAPYPKGQVVAENDFDETHQGAQGRAVWQMGRHTVVLGADFESIHLEQGAFEDDGFGGTSDPAAVSDSFAMDTWGGYANATLVWGAFAVTPGVRYDDNSRTSPFWSPSLGATYRLGSSTVLRGQVARGFTLPAPAWISGSNAFSLVGNPDLEPEQVWSYQAGVETAALGWLWLKGTLFRHEVTDAFGDGVGGIKDNLGWIWRTGAEVEAETAPWHGLVLRGGFSFVRVEKSGATRDQDQYASVLGAYYDGATWHGEVVGSHVWWDYAGGSDEGRHNDPLFDFNVSKTWFAGRTVSSDLFATVHNLFNGDQMVDTAAGTNRRWVEVGTRVRF